MTTLIDNLTPSDDDTELIGSRVGRINPDNFSNQSGSSTPDNDRSNKPLDIDDEDVIDEPVDEAGGPTGEHHQ